MEINTNIIDDYCNYVGDCRACALISEDGECKYKSFMESYEYMLDEFSSDYDAMQPRCYFCNRPAIAGKRKNIEIRTRGYTTKVMVCPSCYKKLATYENASAK